MRALFMINVHEGTIRRKKSSQKRSTVKDWTMMLGASEQSNHCIKLYSNTDSF